jgi:hypothetical protein
MFANKIGSCSACGHFPVAYDAVCCPRCGAQNKNTSFLDRFAGRGSLIGMGAGALLFAGLVFGLVAAGVASLFSTVSGRPVKVPPGKLVTPVALDVHYCGRCREQQEKTKGDDCIYCGRRTVIWNPDRESEHGAHRRWADVNRES